MWHDLVDRLTDWTTMIYTALAFFIPWTLHKINALYRRQTDPPWKR